MMPLPPRPRARPKSVRATSATKAVLRPNELDAAGLDAPEPSLRAPPVPAHQPTTAAAHAATNDPTSAATQAASSCSPRRPSILRARSVRTTFQGGKPRVTARLEAGTALTINTELGANPDTDEATASAAIADTIDAAPATEGQPAANSAERGAATKVGCDVGEFDVVVLFVDERALGASGRGLCPSLTLRCGIGRTIASLQRCSAL
jgi:hypothetical protein